MPEFDTVIKGGTIVDGLRTPRFTADVGLKDGRIAYLGRIASSDAETVLDASGLIVAPGFVDLHTHYDAQIYWDPYCTLSGWHGVTSVVIGNCGLRLRASRARSTRPGDADALPQRGDPPRVDAGGDALGLGDLPRVPR